MKDPQDCTYPHEKLCLRACTQGCVKHKQSSGWRKRQIEDQQAEDEAFSLMLTCEQLGVCQDKKPPCQTCPRL